MKKFHNISEFEADYDLYDKFVETIEVKGDETTFIFDLSHCDDPKRDDENKRYLLRAVFKSSSAKLVEGEIPPQKDVIGGEVLKVEGDQTKLVLGIDWRLRSNSQPFWTEFLISTPPFMVDETIADVE